MSKRLAHRAGPATAGLIEKIDQLRRIDRKDFFRARKFETSALKAEKEAAINGLHAASARRKKITVHR
jgi:hypothetical protein